MVRISCEGRGPGRLASLWSAEEKWFDSFAVFMSIKVENVKGGRLWLEDGLLPVINLFLMGCVIPNMPCPPPTQILNSCLKVIRSTFNCFSALLKQASFNDPSFPFSF